MRGGMDPLPPPATPMLTGSTPNERSNLGQTTNGEVCIYMGTDKTSRDRSQIF